MRAIAIAFCLLVAFTGAVALTPAAHAAPPDIGEGCGYLHWHNGGVTNGVLPGYHMHPCYG